MLNDASSLFDPDRQAEIQEILEDVYKPEELIDRFFRTDR